ncbi:MAG: DUF3768 domain-containing protein [bacterium]|nr:DUF3768 domain-containing protein [bacterium]
MEDKTVERNENVEEIKKLNDLLRGTFLRNLGQVCWTEGFDALEDDVKEKMITKIREYKDFNKGNDTYEEHDFGAVEYKEIKVFWKIDYYDLKMEYHSPDASDPKVTKRVLTIMLADEY